MAAGHLALLCLGVSLLMTVVLSQRRCSVPAWQSELGSNPITANRGKVLLVALLRGYCSYCVGQARRLEALKNSLASQGYADIAMLIVNGGEGISRNNVQNLISASSIRVLQDNSNNVMFRNVFIGNKDDFVVYDRCGHRVAYIPHPYSYLGNDVTERVLKAIHNGRHSCRCRLDRARNNPHDVMYGDQPAQPSNAIVHNTLGLDCPENDTWCRRYLTNYRRNRLEPVTDSQGNELGQSQSGQNIRNHGGHNQQNRQSHSRQHQSRRHRNRNGGTVWNCTNVSLTPVISVPTHRCRCPRSDIGEECKCTRPIYGQANDILSWHCGCHNPSFETRAQCDHCHVCDNRPICREVTQLATWQEYCRCQQAQANSNSTQASAVTWQWQNADGSVSEWQEPNSVWQNSESQTWQWQSSTGEVLTSWQWSNGSSITTNWQSQGSNRRWQTTLSRTWQWGNTNNTVSTFWQWQNENNLRIVWQTQL